MLVNINSLQIRQIPLKTPDLPRLIYCPKVYTNVKLNNNLFTFERLFFVVCHFFTAVDASDALKPTRLTKIKVLIWKKTNVIMTAPILTFYLALVWLV